MRPASSVRPTNTQVRGRKRSMRSAMKYMSTSVSSVSSTYMRIMIIVERPIVESPYSTAVAAALYFPPPSFNTRAYSIAVQPR